MGVHYAEQFQEEIRKKTLPPQTQKRQPGRENEMHPRPEYGNLEIKGSGRLKRKVALITGGDSGIGRAVAVAFAREGADVAFAYLEEEEDAAEACRLIEAKGVSALAVRCDVSSKKACSDLVEKVVGVFGGIDILVNNAAEQHLQDCITDISEEQLLKTFSTNIFAMFHLISAALPHLEKSSTPAIINTTSVTAYRGSPQLLDYSATKGAIVSLTRSLSGSLAEKGIRVNGVAPGPIWTPLIPATFPAEKVAEFGASTPLGRPGQPWECAECYVFLASPSSSYMTGQVLHPNGGEIING